jgi:hypothetical protein
MSTRHADTTRGVGKPTQTLALGLGFNPNRRDSSRKNGGEEVVLLDLLVVPRVVQPCTTAQEDAGVEAAEPQAKESVA